MGFNTLDIAGQIADMKNVDYKNTLAIAVLIELLIDKGLFTRQDFARKAAEMEGSCLAEIALARRMKKLETPE
ncbi:MAG: hypothetical protein N2491_13330 [Negativicutes bacterium]|nr:hypothetical protein [Negativicutes bacterium]